jgi:serine/threonine protein kinase
MLTGEQTSSVLDSHARSRDLPMNLDTSGMDDYSSRFDAIRQFHEMKSGGSVKAQPPALPTTPHGPGYMKNADGKIVPKLPTSAKPTKPVMAPKESTKLVDDRPLDEMSESERKVALTNKFQLGKMLGKGGEGEVFRLNPNTGSKYAPLAAKKMPNAKVKEEVELMKQLPEHKNILNLVGERSEDDKTSSVVTPLAERGDLYQMFNLMHEMVADDKLSPEEHELAVRFLVKQSMKGLDAMHKKGQVHNDVKGQNVMMSRKMTPMVADFGMMSNAKDKPNFGGTPEYMSPEMISGRIDHYDAETRKKSDVYSVGEMLLYGRNKKYSAEYAGDVKMGKDPMAYLAAKRDALTNNRDWATDVEGSEDFQEAIGDMMALDARDRPSMTEAMEEMPLFQFGGQGKDIVRALRKVGRYDAKQRKAKKK